MKKYILFTVLSVVTINSVAQTKIIALKRHSAQIKDINYEQSHNFGECYIRVIDSVTYLGNGTVIEAGHSNFKGDFKDTITNHWNFKNYNHSISELKNIYGNNTVFINLKLYEKERKKTIKKTKQGSIKWLFVLLPILLFRKTRKKLC